MSGRQPSSAMVTWRSLHLADAAVSETLNSRLGAGAGCSLIEHDAMAWLAVAPERCLRMRDLADRSRLTGGGLTRVIDRLVDRGWVVRRTPTENRREVRVTLTDRGLAATEKARAVYAETVEAAFSDHLGNDDLKVLDRISQRLLKRMGLDQFCQWDHDAVKKKAANRVS